MRVITTKIISEYWENHTDSEGELKAWIFEAEHADWRSPQQIKDRHPSASILSGNRVVFNIKGNSYRLVVKIHYNTGMIFVRFISTHAEYDRIDAEKV
jgi:mRNA interferase HigB